ncbi:MAG: metallophosphoesterase family protein [Anaerolineae bacterium]
MRLAILSDIHGNIVALDAVLADIASTGGVDAYWILGDLVDAGPAPVAVLERLHQLPSVQFIRGNTDRYVVTDSPNRFTHPHDAPRFDIEAAGSIGWTQGVVTQGGWFEWMLQLMELPTDLHLQLPDGTTVTGIHAAPGRDTGLGIHTALYEHELPLVIGDCTSDLIFGGHHHMFLDVTIGRQRIINVGSVSLHYPPDLRASYVILHAEENGHHVEHRLVDYDHALVIEQVRQLRHPAAAYIIPLLTGQARPSGRSYIERHLNLLRQNRPSAS